MRERADAPILVVDDLVQKHLAYRASLEELGQDIITVSSGPEALGMLLEREFAVILLDVNMPGMCGHETASIIRQRKKSRHTPIIFITAFADQAQAAEGYALGAVDYILSPIVPEILRAKVKVFVDLYQMRAELFASHVLLEERVAKRTQELAATAVSLKSEVAERTQAEERMSVLVSELTHRVKNLLAVLQSIIMRTLTDSRDIEEGRKILLGRLHALAHAHELLTVACWKGAALNDIVRAELAGFSDRVSANGPVVTLSASAVQTFALVVHELATNAAKYGSLSNAAGSVEIAWGLVEAGGDHYLDFNWKEHDGPEVRPSGQKGFGLTLIGTLAGPLASAPSIDFAPGGLICNFRMPLDVVSASANVEFRLKRPKVAAS